MTFLDYCSKTFQKKIVNYVLVIVCFYSIILAGLHVSICINEHSQFMPMMGLELATPRLQTKCSSH